MMMSLLTCLVAALTISIALRDGCKSATALILLANWLVNTAFVASVGEPNPWMWFTVIDYMSGLALFLGCRTKWQMAVIATYAVQVALHAWFGQSMQDSWDKYIYWWALYYIAWLQITLLGSWIAYDVLGRYLGNGSFIPSRLSSLLSRRSHGEKN